MLYLIWIGNISSSFTWILFCIIDIFSQTGKRDLDKGLFTVWNTI